MTHLDPSTLLAIAGMAAVTYACRAAGVLVFRRVTPGGRLTTVLGYLPGTLFVAYVVPILVQGGPPQWAGAAATAAVMATSRSLAGAIAVGMLAAGAVWLLG